MKIEKFIEQLNNDPRIISAEYDPKSRWKYVVELDSKKYGLLSYKSGGFPIPINKSFIWYNEPYYSFVLYSNTQEELLDDLKEVESIKTEQELANISEENKLKAIKDRIKVLDNSISSETNSLIELKRKYQIDIEKKGKIFIKHRARTRIFKYLFY